MKLVSVSICTRPGMVDITDQDYLAATVCDTRLVVNWECYPIPILTITRCYPTCIIPIDIKFDARCDKIDFLNKAVPYVIKFVAWFVTVLSFIFSILLLQSFFTHFIWSQLL